MERGRGDTDIRSEQDHRERRSGLDRRGGEERRSGKERRSGEERRSGGDRRSGKERQRGEMHEMYQADLDRHLWSVPGSAARRRKRKKRERSRKRKVARFMAGAIGAAGLSYYIYRRWRGDELVGTEEDREAARGEAEEGKDSET